MNIENLYINWIPLTTVPKKPGQYLIKIINDEQSLNKYQYHTVTINSLCNEFFRFKKSKIVAYINISYNFNPGVVIFLDIDGVLNSSGFHQTLNNNNYNIDNTSISIFRCGDYVEKRLIDKLKSLIDYIKNKNKECSVVLVSSWCICNDFIKLIDFFNRLDIPVIGKTDYTGGGSYRADSILAYIKDNEINNYIIIDDSKHFYDGIFDIVQIDGNIGLLDSNIDDYKKIVDNFN